MNDLPGHHRISSAEAERHAIERARSAFLAAGWSVQSAVHDGHNLRVSHGQFRYAVGVKAIPRGSSVPLEDSWSRACLQAQHAANDGDQPLALVVAPKISSSAVERLAAFAAQYAPSVAIGVLDEHGLQEFRGPGLQGLSRKPRESERPRSGKAMVPMNLFSDLNQWLLKVLLAPELPPHLLSGPRAAYRNAYDLAAAAVCSVMSSHRFIEELRREGFLDEDVRPLRLVRRAELFRRWKQAPSHSLPDVAYRVIVPMDVRLQLERIFPAGRACLGLFAAADELGVGLVSGVAPYVLVERASCLPGGVEAADGARNLVIAKRGDPVDLIARIPKAVRSAFRGSVRPSHSACADIIQVWLDVSEHPSRGAEQADFIWNRYLAPLVSESRHT